MGDEVVERAMRTSWTRRAMMEGATRKVEAEFLVSGRGVEKILGEFLGEVVKGGSVAVQGSHSGPGAESGLARAREMRKLSARDRKLQSFHDSFTSGFICDFPAVLLAWEAFILLLAIVASSILNPFI